MANFNGTQVADTISGTNDDDIITGLAGADTINGAGGNDDINGGADGDDIIGGDGNDTIDGGAGQDTVDGQEGSDTYAAPDNAAEDITDTGTGTDDVDTLITDLADDDDLTQGTGSVTLNTTLITGTITGMEQVQVSNANDFIIDLTSGADQFFAFDLTLPSNDYVATGATDVLGAIYQGADDEVHENLAGAGNVTFDQAAGVVINGTTYAAGDTYTTPNGGTVAITFDNVNNVWQFNYTASQQSTIDAGSTVEDEVLAVQMTESVSGSSNVVDAQVTLNSVIGVNVNLTGETDDFTVNGSAVANVLTSGDGDDTLFGGDGADTVVLNEGDNRVWAGAGDTGNDTITANGDGDNIIAGGAGVDDITINGDGDNQAWAGAGNDVALQVNGDGDNIVGGGAGDDEITVAGDGNNQIWGGVGDDNTNDGLEIAAGADGMNTVGGGDGTDRIEINGDGANTIYGGNDDDADVIIIAGNGNNTVFGGGTTAGGGAGTDNQITLAGTGANTVYNGGGDDTVIIAATATGDNTLYGGAGDDIFIFANNVATATIVFTAGSGADEIQNFDANDADHLVDLSALGFADADDVLDSMTQTGADTTLFVTAGQTIQFTGVALTDLQSADPADWLIL